MSAVQGIVDLTWFRGIADHDQPGSRRNRAQQRSHQVDVHHGHFVDNDYVRIQGVIFIPVAGVDACTIYPLPIYIPT